VIPERIIFVSLGITVFVLDEYTQSALRISENTTWTKNLVIPSTRIHRLPHTPYTVHQSFFGTIKTAFNSVYLIDNVKVNCSDMVSVEDDEMSCLSPYHQ